MDRIELLEEEERPELMVPIQLRLPPSMVARIDRVRKQMTVRPTRAWTIRWLLETELNALDSEDDGSQKHLFHRLFRE